MEQGIVLSVSGSVIVVLMGIVGFFLRRAIKSQDKLMTSIDKLALTISGMNATVLVQGERIDSNRVIEKEKHEVIDKRLDNHGNRLDEHDKEITRIKTKIES